MKIVNEHNYKEDIVKSLICLIEILPQLDDLLETMENFGWHCIKDIDGWGQRIKEHSRFHYQSWLHDEQPLISKINFSANIVIGWREGQPITFNMDVVRNRWGTSGGSYKTSIDQNNPEWEKVFKDWAIGIVKTI